MARSRGFRVLAIITIFILGTKVAAARPCGDVRTDVAFAEATLIVKGWLVSTRAGGVPGSDSTSVVRVDRVLKGAAAQPQITVKHFLCGIEYDYAIRHNGPLIAFVTQSGVLVGGTALLPASPRSAGAPSSDAKGNLRSELLLAATDREPSVARAALGAIAELDGADSTATLKQASRGDDLGVRVRALAWLTRFGDVDALRELADVLSGWSSEPVEIPATIRSDADAFLLIAHTDIIRALSSFAERDPLRSTMPRVDGVLFVQIVATIARSNDLSVRRAAVQALRGFKHPATFRVLLGALDDEDDQIRYDAMFALCIGMKAPDLPCPSVPLFQSDEQKYVGRIRAWWAQQQP